MFFINFGPQMFFLKQQKYIFFSLFCRKFENLQHVKQHFILKEK